MQRTKKPINLPRIILLMTIIITIIFCHPLAIIPLSFGFIFLGINDFETKNYRLLKENAAGFLFAVIVFIVWKVGFTTAYESSSMDNLQQFSIQNLFTCYFAISYFNNILHHAFVDLFLLVATLLILYLQRKWLYLLFLILSMLFYFGLIAGTYHSKGFDYYYEHFMLTMIFFMVIYFLFQNSFLEQIKFGWTLLFISLFIIRFAKSNDFREQISEQINWYQNRIDDLLHRGFQKALIDVNDYKQLNRSAWASSTISLVQSSINNPKKSCTVAVVWLGNFSPNFFTKTNIYWADFGEINQDFLNKKYFHIAQKPYVVIDSNMMIIKK